MEAYAMTTVTITTIENYGLYQGKRGIDAHDVVTKTQKYERGGKWYPDSLEETERSGVELPYSDWCSNLAAASCNLLRLNLRGYNGGGELYCNLEPPPYGTYNVWHSILDPSDIATYRSDQVTYPVNATLWNASNLKELLDQCDAYEVKILPALFGTAEFTSGWPYHAWNIDNHYTDGSACAVADRGFLTNAYEFFDDADAIQAAKDRMDFIIDVCGTHKCVVAWELMDEMSWLFDADFWGTTWTPTHINDNIRGKIVPWVQTMAQYIRDNDPYLRPIGGGILRTPSNDWSADADNYWNVINEPFVVYPMDFVATNMYYGEDEFSDAMLHFKRCKEYTDKLIICTQYSPTSLQGTPIEEPSPFLWSKKMCWITVCGERWGITPIRWTGLNKTAPNYWVSGGYADPDYYSIGGVVETFCNNVDWNSWDPDNYVFNDYVSSAGTAEFNSYGDGENVTMLLEWSTSGSKTIDVSNLSDGAYTFTYYDWTLGSISGTMTPTAVGGSMSMSFDATGYQDNMVVAHLIKD